ncbi:hypothetical protein B0H19DRAFT_157481 [Mycena capillaripes]|nr:hypothetical protein B0H19DRAFT_157481 [Mycena capillaripes]
MLHRQVTFDAGVKAQDIVDSRLLPGGRYMALRARNSLMIYDVESGRNIWKLPVDRNATWSLDMVPGGTLVRVVILPTHFPGGHDISIEEVNLATGHSITVFNLVLPTGLKRCRPSILSDFLVFALQPYNPQGTIFLLVNWRAETGVVLNYSNAGYMHSMPQALLTPGHIVATYADDRDGLFGSQLLGVTPLESLAPHWKPLPETNLTLRFDIAKELSRRDLTLVAEEVLYEIHPFRTRKIMAHFRLSAFPSPLHAGAYNIVVYACENKTDPQPPASRLLTQLRQLLGRGASAEPQACAMLLSYRLSPPTSPGGQCGWRHLCDLPAALALKDPSISHAGYCLNVCEQAQRLLPGAGDAVVDVLLTRGRADAAGHHIPTRTVVKREEGWECMRLSQSGAVMGMVDSSVVISYYK